MTETSDLAVVLMAAGKGTRMKSSLPKVLHPVCGRPILSHAIRLGRELGAKRIVAVVGAGQDQVREALAGEDVEFVEQAEQLGTAHAALQARAALADHEGPVLVMNGDHPLYRPETFEALLQVFRQKKPDLALLTADFPDPTGYGRIVRGEDSAVSRVVEEADADEATRAIHEVNLGAYLATSEAMFEWLAKVGKDNAQGEYYLTDVIGLVAGERGTVETQKAADWLESLGVNSRVELAQAEKLMRARLAEHWMREGVTLIDPNTTWIDCDVEIGADTHIEPGVRIKAGTRIGSGCRIEAGNVIENSALADGVWLKPHCHLEESWVGPRCILGPSAHLRPNTRLEDNVRVGNFVEIKNSTLGRGTKADHLSYVGDADVGEGASFGCGSITVNYDGKNKNRTTVGDRAFVGCNSNLIAPVEIEPDAYVAAGSTVTKDVPAGALAVARGKQRNVEGWRAKRFAKDQE